MTAAFATASWPRDPAALGGMPGVSGAWRFAQVVEAAGGPRLEWRLARNCSLTPAQMFGAYLMLCTVSLVIALGFSWHGASPVLAFAAIELLLVGAALLVYARHATDHEQITLADGSLAVRHQRGHQTEIHDFRAAWVRVEPLTSDRSLIELTGDGQTSRVGRYLRPELRQPLAQELRRALRQPLAAPAPTVSIEEPEAK
jgi:uncharacterized membrane protein